MTSLRELVALNSVLFRNSLTDMTEPDGLVRPNGTTNNVAFVAGHLVESRAWTIRYLGGEAAPPFGGLLEHAASLDQLGALPSLAEIRTGWDETSGVLARRLEQLTDPELAAPSPQRFPGVSPTLEGGLAFLVQHESYHIGQLAMLRKYLGYPAMAYR